MPYVLEHRLDGDDGVAIGKSVFLRRVGELFVDDDDAFCECDSRFDEIVQTEKKGIFMS